MIVDLILDGTIMLLLASSAIYLFRIKKKSRLATSQHATNVTLSKFHRKLYTSEFLRIAVALTISQFLRTLASLLNLLDIEIVSLAKIVYSFVDFLVVVVALYWAYDLFIRKRDK